MNTNYRTILAGAIIAATTGAGCVAVISSDDRHYHDENCSDCHDTVVILGKQTTNGPLSADTTLANATSGCAR